MNDGSWPHAEQHRETKPAYSKEIDHKVDPECTAEPHLREDAEGWDEQGNDDAKDIAAGHGIGHTSSLVLAMTPKNEAAPSPVEAAAPAGVLAQGFDNRSWHTNSQLRGVKTCLQAKP